MISDFGLELIRTFEHLELRSYIDRAGKPTIGYGHVILPGETIVEPIDRDEAERLLADDVRKAENALAAWVRVPLTGGQRDALASWVFNVGPRHLEESTLRLLLNRYDYIGAAHELRKWRIAGGVPQPGLLRRRIAEELLFLGGHPLSVLNVAKGDWT